MAAKSEIIHIYKHLFDYTFINSANIYWTSTYSVNYGDTSFMKYIKIKEWISDLKQLLDVPSSHNYLTHIMRVINMCYMFASGLQPISRENM